MTETKVPAGTKFYGNPLLDRDYPCEAGHDVGRDAGENPRYSRPDHGGRSVHYRPGEVIETSDPGAIGWRGQQCDIGGVIDWEQEPSNPKDVLGTTRVDLSLLSPAAMMEEALAYEEGLCKYGRNNYRIVGVRTMIYVGAALRHIWKYVMGEDRDAKTGAHHLGSARACLGIIIDAAAYGKLTDDRPPRCVGFSHQIDAGEERVKHVRGVFAEHSPKHYTIADGAKPDPTR